MGFEYSCFISYTAHENAFVKRFANALHEFLNEELLASAGKPAYLDKKRLEAGFLYPGALAESLCRSACMICIYTTPYFQPGHLFCTREFMGMETLEKVRLKQLNCISQGKGKHEGLIIPLVLRGSKTLPSVIKDSRHYESLEDYQTYTRDIISNPYFADKLRPVCEYIADRFLELEKVENDPCACCNDFQLPTDTEAKEWLIDNSVTPPKPQFPDFSKSEEE